MKNKIFINIVFLFTFIVTFKSFAIETFSYEADNIKILNSGKSIVGENNIKVVINNNIIIFADKLIYNRDTKILELSNNINLEDKINNIKIQSKKIIYNENDQLLVLLDKVKFDDKINDTTVKAEKVTYNQNDKIFILNNNIKYIDKKNKLEINTNQITINKQKKIVFSPVPADINISKNYNIKTTNFKFSKIENTISSKNEVSIKDKEGNTVKIEKFNLEITPKKFKGSKIKFYDQDQNEFIIENAMVDLKNNKIIGKDLEINFNKSFFGNPNNDPRLKAKSVKKDHNISSVEKGVFTTCKKNDDCPPWTIYADKIEHNSDTKMIAYKNALLKIYDVPVIYLPNFSHPDPTVRRQSGFLNPYISDTKNLGSSITIPYYFVISDNKDFTLSPKLYADDKLVLQNEYRQKNKNSDHILDFSFNSANFFDSKKETKSHFFANSKFYPEISNLKDVRIISNFEKVSNDSYLKLHNFNSELIEDTGLLNSYLSIYGSRNNSNFDVSLEVYENLSKPKSDRYEFVYPNYSISNNFNYQNKFIENINFTSFGHQKKYNTNIYEGIITNDILISTNENINQTGIKNNFEAFFKNVNSDGNNSDKFKNEFNQSFFALVRMNNEYPLTKENNEHEFNLIPKLNLMYSPNKSKNIANENKTINIDNIYSLNRLGVDDTIEGGLSSTIGFDYKKLNKNNLKEVFGLSLATVIRVEENFDLPKVSSIGQKNSDLFGKINIEPSNNFNVKYDFSVDNNLDKLNQNLLSSEFKVNNFITKFEFSNDNRLVKKEKHISNTTEITLSNNGLIGFDIKKDKITNATEFYNIYYSYFNDCLEASIKFGKDFYYDKDINPEKKLEFTLTIIPFSETSALTSL